MILTFSCPSSLYRCMTPLSCRFSPFPTGEMVFILCHAHLNLCLLSALASLFYLYFDSSFPACGPLCLLPLIPDFLFFRPCRGPPSLGAVELRCRLPRVTQTTYLGPMRLLHSQRVLPVFPFFPRHFPSLRFFGGVPAHDLGMAWAPPITSSYGSGLSIFRSDCLAPYDMPITGLPFSCPF